MLISTIVVIAHLIGLPYYWQKSQLMTICLIIFGYWLLINVVFHCYMAVFTPPGYPPNVSFIHLILFDPVSFTPHVYTIYIIRFCLTFQSFQLLFLFVILIEATVRGG